MGLCELEQFIFDRQWRRVREYANKHGVRILGDLPIFVALDSADVWAHPELFKLDAAGLQSVVAGVPPDYFSETGQLWGNPIYDWPRLAASGYELWVYRVRGSLQQVDALRLDHFRGFQAYWEVPAGETTAIGGHWVAGPRADLFTALRAALGELAIVAEDL